jgi:REP-associated tyrosine transposase
VIHGRMPLNRTSPAVYDKKYHLVWAPEYRRWIGWEDIRRRLEQVFREIAEDFGSELIEWEVAKEHVPVFLNFPLRYSVAKVVGIFKSISASQLFREYPELKEHWRTQAFREEGYLVRTVGDGVTVAVVQRYIRYHRQEKHEAKYLNLF